MREDKRQWIINLNANLDDVSTKLVDVAGVRVGPPSVRSTYAGRLQISAVVCVNLQHVLAMKISRPVHALVPLWWHPAALQISRALFSFIQRFCCLQKVVAANSGRSPTAGWPPPSALSKYEDICCVSFRRTSQPKWPVVP